MTNHNLILWRKWKLFRITVWPRIQSTKGAQHSLTLLVNIWKIIYLHCEEASRCFTNSRSEQFPVGLIAQLIKHCTGIAEVIGSTPVQAWLFFFQALISQPLKFLYHWDDQTCLHIFLRSSKIWSFIYSVVFFIIYGSFYGYITSLQRNQLSIGLIAQLVEHCTGIARFMGSNSV